MVLLIHDQAASLRKQINGNSKIKKAKTIAIISGKGGVGKSNFAVNFSLELLNHKHKVLIIDLDVGMGNIDILLGLQSKKNIIDFLNNQSSIFDMIESGPNGLAYIAGGTSLTSIFSIDQQKMNHFFTEYDKLQEHFDYIIFDMGAGVSEASMFFILASDESILITTSEPTSITDAYAMTKQLISHGNRHPIHVVLNRCESDKQGKQTANHFQNIVLQFLETKVNIMGVLPDDKTVIQAVMHQKPYLLLSKKAPVSVAMSKIVSNYLTNSNEINQLNSSSFVHRLKKFFKVR